MPKIGKDGVSTIFLELVNQGNSGWIQDETRGKPYEQSLHAPTIEWIPATGVIVYEKDGIKQHKRARHIKGCNLLDPVEQEKAGWKPNKKNDKIPFAMAFATVRREGSTLITYDYLTSATYFEDNPLRPSTATALYREIKIDERAVNLIDEDELLTVAKSKVFALRLNIGKGYKYDEDKINSYCKLLNIFAETPEQQLVVIMDKARSNPKSFLDIVVQAEQTVITEISHAMQLGVIMFDKNTAQYTKESKVITNVGNGNMSENKKIEALSNYLQTPEGNNALTELRTNLEIAKEAQFKS